MVRTTDLLRRTLGDHIALATTLAPDLWSISTDPDQIESALTNLAINARDAMPNGGRLIIETRNAVIDADQVATGLDMKPGEYVTIGVSDTGTGIPTELRDRVFEPFFTTKEQRHGSGLGLAMIYGFVKQSGGHVTLYSEMGHGTTITMYLPRAEPVLVATEAAERRQIQSTPGGSLILVVEDDEDVRQLTVTRLRHLGYQVAEASDGVKALAMLRAGLQPALVFSDAIMPGGISGRELLEQAVTVLPSVKLLLYVWLFRRFGELQRSDAAALQALAQAASTGRAGRRDTRRAWLVRPVWLISIKAMVRRTCQFACCTISHRPVRPRPKRTGQIDGQLCRTLCTRAIVEIGPSC